MITRRTALASIAALMAAPSLTKAAMQQDYLDVAYAGHSPRNIMDIHRPKGDGLAPVLLDIHGGGFRMGDKRELPLPQQVLDRGIAVVRMNYRLSQQARWPAQQEDVLSAVAYLHRHGTELGLAPDRIALKGRSAGAFLAVSAALSMAQAGAAPAAVVNFYGPMDFGSMDSDMARSKLTVTRPPADSAQSVESLLVGYAVGERRQEATAMGPVGRLENMARGVRLPPLMIRHGMRDNIVSGHQAEHLRDAWRLVDSDVPIDLELLTDAGHGTAAFVSPRVMDDLATFLERHLAPRASG